MSFRWATAERNPDIQDIGGWSVARRGPACGRCGRPNRSRTERGRSGMIPAGPTAPRGSPGGFRPAMPPDPRHGRRPTGGIRRRAHPAALAERRRGHDRRRDRREPEHRTARGLGAVGHADGHGLPDTGGTGVDLVDLRRAHGARHPAGRRAARHGPHAVGRRGSRRVSGFWHIPAGRSARVGMLCGESTFAERQGEAVRNQARGGRGCPPPARSGHRCGDTRAANRNPRPAPHRARARGVGPAR